MLAIECGLGEFASRPVNRGSNAIASRPVIEDGVSEAQSVGKSNSISLGRIQFFGGIHDKEQKAVLADWLSG